VVATTVIGEPEGTGARTKVTGTALAISPKLESDSSVTAAVNEKLPSPPGLVMVTDCGFEDGNETAALSLLTVNVADPELPKKTGFVLT
jgi:hypothetical protein